MWLSFSTWTQLNMATSCLLWKSKCLNESTRFKHKIQWKWSLFLIGDMGKSFYIKYKTEIRMSCDPSLSLLQRAIQYLDLVKMSSEAIIPSHQSKGCDSLISWAFRQPENRKVPSFTFGKFIQIKPLNCLIFKFIKSATELVKLNYTMLGWH